MLECECIDVKVDIDVDMDGNTIVEPMATMADEDSIDEIEIIEVNSCNPKEEPSY